MLANLELHETSSGQLVSLCFLTSRFELRAKPARFRCARVHIALHSWRNLLAFEVQV
jgi:hypothetical protein